MTMIIIILITRMALSRAHTSAEAADVAKWSLLNKYWVTQGVWRRLTRPVTVTLTPT